MTIPDEAVQADKTLWCVNIAGPDDIVSAPDYLTAVHMANTFNAWWLDLITKTPLTDNHPRMWAEPIEWPYSEGHGEDVTEPNNEYHWLRELTAQAPSPRAQALEELHKLRSSVNGDYVLSDKEELELLDAAIRAISQPVADGVDTIEVIPSSGCVFADMGVERPASPVASATRPTGGSDHGE